MNQDVIATAIRKIIRKSEVLAQIPLSDPTLWRMEQRGEFPKRMRIGGKAIGWFQDEIEAWQNDRAAHREHDRKFFVKTK